MAGRAGRPKPLLRKDLRRLAPANLVPLFSQNPQNKKNKNHQINYRNHFVNPQGRKSRTPNEGMRVTHLDRLRSSSESERLSRSDCSVVRCLEDTVKLAFEPLTPRSVPLVEPLNGIVCLPSGNLKT